MLSTDLGLQTPRANFLQAQKVRIHCRSAAQRICIGMTVGNQDNMLGGIDSVNECIHIGFAIIELLAKDGVSFVHYRVR